MESIEPISDDKPTVAPEDRTHVAADDASNATEPATPWNALIEQLAERPWTVGFFWLMREIERLNADLPRWGASPFPGQDPARLAQPPLLGFAPSEIARVVPADREASQQNPQAVDLRVPRIETNVLGVAGPAGPMPGFFIDHIRNQERRRKDKGARAFLDIFHHRLLSLFYRAWAAGRPVVELDRTAPQDSLFAGLLATTFGGAGRLDRLPPDLVRYSGRFAAAPRAPDGLKAILEGNLRIAVEVIEFIGGRIPVRPSDRTYLISPRRRRSFGALTSRVRASEFRPSRLDGSAVLGSTFFDPALKFRLRLGPMSWDRYAQFLSRMDRRGRMRRSATMKRLAGLTRAYVQPGVSYDVQLMIEGKACPPPRLGRAPLRLGQSTWLAHHPKKPPRTRGDLVLRSVG